MKLTSAQVQRTLSQFKSEAEAIPDNHPVVPQPKPTGTVIELGSKH